MTDFGNLKLSLISSLTPMLCFVNDSEHLALDKVTVIFNGSYFQAKYTYIT